MTWKNLSVCALVTLWALPVWATPSQMNVDGVLRDTGGNLVNADIGITFSLHGQTDGSDLLWQETQAVSVKNGVFSSKIPSDPASSPFPDGIFGGDSAYLQIQSAGQDALPMISLAFVPYAMHAKASASADKALALDCEACIETPMLSASVTIAASQVTYDDAANGLGATVQNALDGLFAQITGLTFADLVGGSDAVIAVIADDGFARLSDLPIVAITGQFGDLKGIPAGLSDGDNDTQLSSEQVLQMVSDGGISTGAHTVDTTRSDAEIQAVVGNHTVDTDTQLSSEQVLQMVSDGGIVTGAHTVDTTRSDAEIQAVVGAHTVDTDTQLSSADVLGMVSNGGYVTGGHTTDTKLSEAEVDSFVSNNNYAASSHTHSYAASSHTHSYAASSHSHSYAASSHSHSYLSTGGGTLTGSLAMSSNKVTGLAAPTADADAATKAYVDAAAGGGGSSITTVKCNGSASGYDNPSCVASCPSGMKIIHSQVYCHFSNLGPQVTYVGEGMMSHDTWVYSCLKLPDSATTNVFRAYTPKANIGSYPTNKQVHGIIHCITAS